MNLRNIAILEIKNTDFCCIITGISKIEALNLMQNNDLIEKSRISWVSRAIFEAVD